jgi:TRAP transporter TAXI family solute receptor
VARVDTRHLTWGDALRIGVPLVIIILAAFYVTSRFVKPAPPDHLVMSTGAPGGAYERYARMYQAFLARNGVTLELKSSEGAVENLARLTAGTVDAAFVQGGLGPPIPTDTDDPPSSAISSLGAMYLEPVWVFARTGGKPLEQVRDLAGRRIAVGAPGSGTNTLAVLLLRAIGVDSSNATFVPLTGEDASAALVRGDVDAAVFIVGVSAPLIGDLIRRPDIEIVNFVHAQALARQHPFMVPLTLPSGLIDVKADLPNRDVGTVAVTANLLVRSDLHPALIYLLLDAASQIHGRQSLLADAHTFPNPARQEYPVADEAERFYKSGKPFLQRYLPYWVANLVDRMLVFLIPLVAVLLPTLRFLPDLYTYQPRARIAALYEKLRTLERDVVATPDPALVADYVARLDRIEAEVIECKLPAWFVQETYALRAAIDLVRERLGRPGTKALPRLRT